MCSIMIVVKVCSRRYPYYYPQHSLCKPTVHGLNIFIDIQTSKTLIQMDINKMMKMEFIQ